MFPTFQIEPTHQVHFESQQQYLYPLEWKEPLLKSSHFLQMAQFEILAFPLLIDIALKAFHLVEVLQSLVEQARTQ